MPIDFQSPEATAIRNRERAKRDRIAHLNGRPWKNATGQLTTTEDERERRLVKRIADEERSAILDRVCRDLG